MLEHARAPMVHHLLVDYTSPACRLIHTDSGISRCPSALPERHLFQSLAKKRWIDTIPRLVGLQMKRPIVYKYVINMHHISSSYIIMLHLNTELLHHVSTLKDFTQ